MEAARAALSREQRREWSAAIAARLWDSDEWRSAGLVHAYVGIEPEVATRPILERAWAEGKRVACPRVVWRPRGLASYAIESADQLLEGPRGLREPDPDRCEVVDGGFDLILVPGLAFDRHGARVGYGAGFYDRFLAGTEGVKVALAYSLQVFHAVPVEPHDVAVDRILTEQETIDCRVARLGRSKGVP